MIRDLEIGLLPSKDRSGLQRARFLAFLILLFFLIASLGANSLPFGYPVWSFLLSDTGSFDDFTMDRDEDLRTYLMGDPMWGALPPVALMLGRSYGLVPHDAGLVLFSVSLVAICAVITLLTARRLSALLFLIVGFPLAFALFRGNNDIFLFPFVMLYWALLVRERFFAIAFLVGVTTAFEPITILFAIPLLLRHRVKEYLVFLLSATMAWLSPFLFGPRNYGEYLELASRGFSNYTKSMALFDGGVLFGNSLWSLGKIVLWNMLGVSNPESGYEIAAVVLPWFRAFSLLLLIVIFVGTWRLRGQAEVITLSLAIAVVLVPDVSATYKMSGVLAALIIYLYRAPSPRALPVTCICFAMAPKSFISWTLGSGGIFTLDSILNPVLLSIALLLLTTQSRRDRKPNGSEERSANWIS